MYAEGIRSESDNHTDVRLSFPFPDISVLFWFQILVSDPLKRIFNLIHVNTHELQSVEIIFHFCFIQTKD